MSNQTEENRISLAEFIAQESITMTAKWTEENRNMEGSAEMDNWICTLRAGRKSMRVPFSMGRGLGGKEPTAEEVLNCLALDASGLENGRGSFEDWASEYGYDTDSRKAFRTFRTVQRQAEKLQKFLSPEAYQQLLWNTESL